VYLENKPFQNVIRIKLEEIAGSKSSFIGKDDGTILVHGNLQEGLSFDGMSTYFQDMSSNYNDIVANLSASKTILTDISNNQNPNPTEMNGALDDAKNMILMQNTVYTVGTLAIATLLISVMILSSKT
jgi:hypothetical protein